MYVAAVLIVVPVVTLAISRLKPAAPSVERATVWTDTVKRGEMLRQVRGLGTLVPEDIRWIPAATQARVADPKRLKATIKIPEVQAKDVQIGQVAEIDTRNGVVPGRVSRIDPAVQNGTVTVDVSLDGALPQGARPDLSVDGTIEIERLADVLYVGRPVHGQPASTVGIFKLVEGGKEAVRVQVKLGRSSVSTIEIVEGLKVGDQVILSDMSNWDSFDRIRLN